MELVNSRKSLLLLSRSLLSKRTITDSSAFDTSDDDLVRVLTEATEEVAGAFKARGKSSFFLFFFSCFRTREN